MNNIRRNKTKKIRKYKGGLSLSFKSKPKASTSASATPTATPTATPEATKPTMKGRISSMFGFKKKGATGVDPSGNSVTATQDANATTDANATPDANATTDANATPDANATTSATPVAPADAVATGAAVATAAASNVVIEAVKEPLKTGIQEVGQIIPEATEAIGVGLVKAGSNIAGAIPFVGALMDIGNAANAFTEMIKKLANTGSKLSNTVSDVAEKTKENIESKMGGFQQGGRILKRTNDSIKQFEDPIHNLNYYRHHNIKKNRNITRKNYQHKNNTRKRF